MPVNDRDARQMIDDNDREISRLEAELDQLGGRQLAHTGGTAPRRGVAMDL